MSPIRKLIVYSLSMIILPLLSYFVSHHIFDLFTADHWANIYAAVVAVLVVHCVLFAFVYQAYYEDRVDTQRELEKKSD